MDLHWRLENIISAPAYDSSCDPRCSSDRAIHPIAKKIIHIPHYKLSENLNLNKILKKEEIDSIENKWYGYNNDVKGTRGQGVSSYWTSKFLRNWCEDPDFGFGETWDFMEILGKQHLIKDGRVPPEHLMDTTLQLPYIRSIIEKFVTWEMCDRILISKVDDSERINWHSHCPDYYPNMYHGVFCVSSPDDSYTIYAEPFDFETAHQNKDYSNINIIDEVKSIEGNCHIINDMTTPHKSTINNSDEPRITLAFDIVGFDYYENLWPRKSVNQYIPLV